MRPGCDRPAVARLSYDPITCSVWLDDVAERVGRNQEICALHADRLTVPRGWDMADRRADQAPMFATPVETERVDTSPKRHRRRSSGSDASAQTLALFDVLRQELAASEPATESATEPATELVPATAEAEAVENVDEIEPVDEAEPDEERLPDSLRATSPLLSRAFAATGHQRSVLTQLSPTESGADIDPSSGPR